MFFFNEIKQIEINPTELCNLACSFCPRSTFYPNQNLHMNLDVAKEIRDQMIASKFSGVLSITGRGEPTLHPDFKELVNLFVGYNWKLKIHTNGKKFKEYQDFILSSFHDIHYNCYNIDWKEIYEKYGHYPNVKVIHKPIDSYMQEDWTTNRAGSFQSNKLPIDSRCDVIFHKMFIDIDGSYRLCCEDWKHKINMGNIFQEDIVQYIEDNKDLQRYRKSLINGERQSLSPCSECDYNVECNKYNKLGTLQKYKKLVEISD